MKGCNGSNILTILWNDGNGYFSFENPVNILDNQLINDKFNVFPNPFTNQLEIQLATDRSLHFQIIINNLLGQNIQVINLSNPDKAEEISFEWDGRDISGKSCPAGIYFITVISNSRKCTKKVVKM